MIALLSNAQVLFAQSNSEGLNYFIYALLAVVVLLFFVMIIQVSDNLLAIEAKQLGVDDTQNVSLFPSWSDLFPKRMPEFVQDKPVRMLKQGHDILLQGAAEEPIEDLPVTTCAVQPNNFIGLSPIPKVTVEVGQEVKAGDVIFFDKKRPEIKFVAPVSGEIAAINRGAKRAITEIVILADKELQYRTWEAPNPMSATREELVQFLLENGGWPLLNQRPYDVLPDPQVVPRDIFISTFDTAPLAPNLDLVVEGQEAAFQEGLNALAKLTSGKVHLGLNARQEEPPAVAFTEATGVEQHWFHGKHPAGNVGVQIHHIASISGGDDIVWTLTVQDVITLGKMFSEGRFDATRVIAVVGAELEKPRYVRTVMGAKVGDLVGDQAFKSEKVRLISGDVLSGKKKEPENFLSFRDDQLTVIEEGDYFELFGWLLPINPRPSVSGTFPNFLFPGLKFKADTNTHGERRAFVVSGQYERVLPMDIYVQHLMKSILIQDFEQMEGLGIHELSEEDVALCEFVCTSKQPLQDILRQGLDTMRIEG